MTERGSPDREFLPGSVSGVGELKRRRVCGLAVVLMLGLGATVGCSGAPTPVEPSPGVDTTLPAQTGSGPTSTSGPGETRPGIRLVVVPRPDGSFDITEDVMLPQATEILPLRLPSSGARLPGMMAATKPRATNLKVTADKQSVPVRDTTVTGPVDLPLTTFATRLRLTYRLSGSTVLATPSKSVRAGAAIRPLVASSAGRLPTNITVTTGLLNAVCPLLTEPRCTVGDPPKLKVIPGIPATKALVVLQLDLPR